MKDFEVKREFNNGIEDCQEIYNSEYKIFDIKNRHLWNTDINHPIVIVKSRANNYVRSEVPAEKIVDKKDKE